MAIALEQLVSIEGAHKKQAEDALNKMVKQLEQVDDVLKNRTDQEIWELFQAQQQEIDQVEMRIKALLDET